MRSIKFALITAALFSLSTLAQAAKVSGTVQDKTTGKPAAGDKVELVDVQAGMSVADSATTDASGRYTLNKPGNGPYLVRVTHQGSPYFIAAPEGAAPATFRSTTPVPKWAASPSKPTSSSARPRTASSTSPSATSSTTPVRRRAPSTIPRTDSKSCCRPTPSSTAQRRAAPPACPRPPSSSPPGPKNHFMFDFPIQPDEKDPSGEAKDTLFQVGYHVPYSSGFYTFKPELLLPADNVAFLLPKSITFKGPGFHFRPAGSRHPDVARQKRAARAGTRGHDFRQRFDASRKSGPACRQRSSPAGCRPQRPWRRHRQPHQHPRPAEQIQVVDPAGNVPRPVRGGRVPAPPARRCACRGWCRRAPPGFDSGVQAAPPSRRSGARRFSIRTLPMRPPPSASASHNSTLLTVLKEELFAIESEKLSGTLSPNEYKEQKAALETVLKRALAKK